MMEADQDGDGKLDFEEFKAMVANTDIAKQMVRFLPLAFLHESSQLTQALAGERRLWRVRTCLPLASPDRQELTYRSSLQICGKTVSLARCPPCLLSPYPFSASFGAAVLTFNASHPSTPHL